MQYLIWAGSLIALLAYIPLLLDVWRGNIQLNIATWLIWSFVDAVLFFALLANHADAMLAGAFAIGNIIVVLFILKRGEWRWRLFESVVLTGAIVSLGVWCYVSAFAATLTIVVIKYFIAIAPSLHDAYVKPEKKQSLSWLMYSLGGLLSVIGIGSWTLASSFYPTISCLANGTMSALHSRVKKA